MKTRLLLLLISLFSVFALFSCNKSGDVEVPDGMQLAGGAENGYYLFVPEEWTVSNLGNITAAYASSLDPTSVSMTVCDKPSGQTFKEYFDASIAELSPSATDVTEKTGRLGNASDAVMFSFKADYNGHPYRFMEILASYGEKCYIFTYAGSLELRGESEETYYDYRLDDLASVIENVRFISPEGTFASVEKGVPDGDGYCSVSDAELSGFTFYAPSDWECVLSSGIVEVKTEDGADVNMTQATGTGVSVKDYWENRREELSALVSDFHVIRENEVITFAGSASSALYEYTYVFRGKTYHVYQVLTVIGSFLSQKGYVFTYTAPETVYDSHLSEVLKMGEKVTFR